jgi:type I restriction enzyme M protein
MFNLKKYNCLLRLRSLEKFTAEILELEQETEELLKRLVSFGEVK